MRRRPDRPPPRGSTTVASSKSPIRDKEEDMKQTDHEKLLAETLAAHGAAACAPRRPTN